ncbi:hypothetical protein SAMN05421842_1157 [Clostridium uliginosum]|uniref:Cell division protein FtsL n=1 Tax=Clostridium uliginosum TaxID=119641 RepID=A0A1I1NM70_9CLOT|nr:hypothetical protein SAMN05421842_1157 [Clostridium uliginosum]
MAGREYDYIKGNTVVKPSRKSVVTKPKKKQSDLQRVKKSKNKRVKNETIETRKSTLMISIVILSLGIFVIGGDAKVYNMQKKVTDVSTQISSAQETNEALKVKLLKFGSLENIKKNSEEKLSMIVPTKKDIAKIDFSENYFENVRK